MSQRFFFPAHKSDLCLNQVELSFFSVLNLLKEPHVSLMDKTVLSGYYSSKNGSLTNICLFPIPNTP